MALPIIMLDELAEGSIVPKPLMDKAPFIGPIFQVYRGVSNARVVTGINNPVVWAT